ncbi:MAG: hypothetical protein KDA44_20760, partial [Planctomycetales bacterium]|nr:hypothetical protein [Planctomycetales bacterium]
MDQQLQLVHCVLPRWFGDEPPASVKLWQAAGSHSGAAVWRVSCGERDYCLRRWPTTGPSPRRLAAIHQFQQRLSANGSEITPTLIPATGSATQVEHRQAAWHLETWRPGAADLQRPVSEEKLAAAVQ